ncbi:hypothetical protein [Bradyrhizobium sp. AS23.2]|uniref:hypothetical protein n=1 Tax=Bradyrhizobium sp. AS23.2 TaxID=1680155 RepID=UPI00093BBE9D|nr:hypothetical protein [Bradyrhizobium sp. AS23.2]OKO84873.1 hypothetical protein AC630_07980 [Bradyrhizobium sp. AS23.2]
MLYDPNVLKTVPDCRLALKRATQAGEVDFVKPLYVRLAQLGGVGYSDPLEAAFHSLLAVYEQTLKRGRASRVRKKLHDLGGGTTAVEQILMDWCLANKMSSGFERLVKFGLKDRVGEYIVGIDFPGRFSPEVVEAARAKLIRYEIVTPDELTQLIARPRN